MTRELSEFELEQRESVGRCFAEEREALGLTQRQLAEDMGRGQAQVTRFEKGQQDFKLSTLQEWPAYFGYYIEINLIPMETEEEDDVESGSSEVDESDQ